MKATNRTDELNSKLNTAEGGTDGLKGGPTESPSHRSWERALKASEADPHVTVRRAGCEEKARGGTRHPEKERRPQDPPNLMKGINQHVQAAQRTLGNGHTKKTPPRPTTGNLLKAKRKKKTLRAAREEKALPLSKPLTFEQTMESTLQRGHLQVLSPHSLASHTRS